MPGIGQVGFEEGNAIQYTWSVPQNLAGLFAAIGGNAAVVSKLNTFFTQLNAGRKQPYDWAGNEPSLGIPWEYDYAGAPWRTQSVVRRIITTLYGPTPNGEPGNDDLGAMSSWYVWAALGLYPETPGRGELVLGSPLFPHITMTLGSGHAIVIDAPGATRDHSLRAGPPGRWPRPERHRMPGDTGHRPDASGVQLPVAALDRLGHRGPARCHPGIHPRRHLGRGRLRRPSLVRPRLRAVPGQSRVVYTVHQWWQRCRNQHALTSAAGVGIN